MNEIWKSLVFITIQSDLEFFILSSTMSPKHPLKHSATFIVHKLQS